MERSVTRANVTQQFSVKKMKSALVQITWTANVFKALNEARLDFAKTLMSVPQIRTSAQ